MTRITIECNEGHLEDYAKAYGWSDTIVSADADTAPNPISAEEFVTEHIQNHYCTVVCDVRANKAAEAARKLAVEETEQSMMAR